jgi:acetyltransferase
LSGLLGEVRSKQLLADYGIPVVPTRVAMSVDEAMAHADQLGYPIVLKILSPDISHKTDLGGVILNIANGDALRSNYDGLLKRIRDRDPNTRIEGVTVQPMISVTRGVELLLGMKRDPQFGPVFVLGAGGITAELQHDSVLELAPLDDHLVDQMLRKLRLYPLLEGFRGRTGVDLVQLRDVVARFFQLAEDLPEVAAAEINPLLATSHKIVALDARVVLANK